MIKEIFIKVTLMQFPQINQAKSLEWIHHSNAFCYNSSQLHQPRWHKSPPNSGIGLYFEHSFSALSFCRWEVGDRRNHSCITSFCNAFAREVRLGAQRISDGCCANPWINRGSFFFFCGLCSFLVLSPLSFLINFVYVSLHRCITRHPNLLGFCFGTYIAIFYSFD